MVCQYGCATDAACHGVNVVMNAECHIATVMAVIALVAMSVMMI